MLLVKENLTESVQCNSVKKRAGIINLEAIIISDDHDNDTMNVESEAVIPREKHIERIRAMLYEILRAF